MSITVTCSECQGRFSVPDKFAGKRTKCPKCGGVLDIQAPPLMPPVAAPPTASAVSPPAVPPPPRVHSNPRLTVARRPSPSQGIAVGGEESSATHKYRQKHKSRAKVPAWAWFVAGALLLGSGVGYALYQNTHPVVAEASSRRSTKRPAPPSRPGEQNNSQGEWNRHTTFKPSGTLSARGLSVAGKSAPPKPKSNAPLEDVYDYIEHGIVLIESYDERAQKQGIGSGFVIDRSGLVVTNYHVVENAHSAQAVFKDGSRWSIDGYSGVRPEADLAILKLPDMPSDVVVLDIDYKEKPRELSQVVAIGHPENHQFSPFDGRVVRTRLTSELPEDAQDFLSYLGTKVDHLWIEHKTGIAPGNSGGPLVDYNGRVLGINTWVIQHLELGYALHVQHIRDLRYDLLPKVASMDQYRREHASVTRRNLDAPKLTIERIEKLYTDCSTKGMRPQTNQEYRLVQSLAWALTGSKFRHEQSDPSDPHSDQFERLAQASDKVIEQLAQFDWKGFAHWDQINQFADRAIDTPRAGIYLVATVEKSFSEKEGRPGLVLDMDGKDRKIYVPLAPGSKLIKSGTRCVIFGVSYGTDRYGDNPLSKIKQHVILSKCVFPFD